MSTSIRAAFVAGLLCSTVLCVDTAHAQLAAPAPVRQNLDANGVDLFSLAYTLAGPRLTIGQAQGLAYQRYNRGGGWTDDYIATLEQNATGTMVTVSLGDSSDLFTASGQAYANTQGNGASLTFSAGTFTYTSADGTIIRFAQNRASPRPYYANLGRAVEVIRPDGERLTYGYSPATYCTSFKPGTGECIGRSTAYRVSRVSDNYGYALTFGYASNFQDPDSGDVAEWSTITSVSASNLAVVNSPTPTMSLALVPNGSGYSNYEITDAAGRKTTFRSGANSVVLVRPGSTTDDVTWTRSSPTALSMTNAAGTTSYAYSDSASTRTTTVTNPLGQVTTYTFDIDAVRMRSMTNALNQTTRYDYDTQGRLTRTTLPEGNRMDVTYIDATRPAVTEVRQVSKTPGTPPDIVTTAGYPTSCTSAATCNQPLWTRDARDNQTDYTYDATTGLIETVTAPAAEAGGVRAKTTYSYAPRQAYFNNGGGIVASGQPVTLLTGTSSCQTQASCTGTADEVRTTVDYGPQTAGVGNNLLPVSTQTGAGDGSLTAVLGYGYDAIGNRTSVDGPLPGAADTTTYRYDADRWLTGTISPDPDGAGALKRRAQKLTYDPKGRIILSEYGTVTGITDPDWAAFVPYQALAATYDGVDRPLTQTLQSGGTAYALTQYGYDHQRLLCTTVRMNPSQWSALPADACAAQAAGGSGPDRVERITSYDALDRPLAVTRGFGQPEASTDQTSYNANGTTASVTDGNGNVTTYGYDGFDRATTIVYPAPISDYEYVTLDPAGNVTDRRLRDGSHIGFQYDARNRLTLKTLPNGEPATTYAYDLLSRATALTKAGEALGFTYDALSRLRVQTSPVMTMTADYDLAGRRTRLAWSDGLHEVYDRLVTGEAYAVRENGAVSGAGVLATWTYDDLGRRRVLTRGNGTTTSYEPDPVSRLVSLTQDLAATQRDVTAAFSYTPASQIAQVARSNDIYAYNRYAAGTKSYSVNSLNQATAENGAAITYDARGNLKARGGATYAYSAENLLTSASNGTTLGYDAGLRLSRITSPGSETRFGYDGLDRVSEVNAAGAVLRRYAFDPDAVDAPLVWYEGSDTANRRWLHADERGSIVAVSGASGAAVATNRYDEDGVPAPTNVGVFGYTGQAWLPELRIWYYKARMYAPNLARFLQTDPIGYGGGMNLYAYVGGDPVNATDPLGLLCAGLGPAYENLGRAACKTAGGQYSSDIVVTGPRYAKESVGTESLRFGSVNIASLAANLTLGLAESIGDGPQNGKKDEDLLQCVANNLDIPSVTGAVVAGAAAYGAGAPLLSKLSLTGKTGVFSGGANPSGGRTSVLSAAARGLIGQGPKLEPGGFLARLTNTGKVATAVGRIASVTARVAGVGLEALAAGEVALEAYRCSNK